VFVERARGRQAGFSLLEILVAFVILSLSIGVIMRVFSTGMRNIDTAERHTRATLLAENVLSGLGEETALSAGELSGEDGRGYRWRARVSEHLPPGMPADAPGPAVRLYQIDLEVNWGEPTDRSGGLRFSTLRVARRQ
jgi:general secretion pathway protein I